MPITLPAQMEERKAGSSLPSNCDSGWATLLESGGDLAQNSVPLIINNQSVWEQFRPSSRAAAATYTNNSNIQSSAEGAHSIRDLREFKETLINSGCLRSADAVKIAVTSSPDNYSAECVRSCAGTNVPGGTGADDWCPSNSYCNNGNPANMDAFRQGVNSNVANYNSNGKVLLEGSFGRLLDPSTTTIPCSDPMDEYPVSNMLSHPLSSKPTFHSSNILTFHSNMGKLDMAYPAPKPNHHKSGGSASDSSSASNSSNNALQKSSVDEGGESTTEQKRNAHQVGPLGNNAFKKPRTEPSPMKVQVRKERLGERITALQQLVSPFGKTDTASVLLEAMGYIKFLQEQVQVLSTPYLKGLPVSSQIDGIRGDEAKYDLRSRGLCLVPVSCTLHVANNNGADFWTSGIGSSSKF